MQPAGTAMAILAFRLHIHHVGETRSSQSFVRESVNLISAVGAHVLSQHHLPALSLSAFVHRHVAPRRLFTGLRGCISRVHFPSLLANSLLTVHDHPSDW